MIGFSVDIKCFIIRFVIWFVSASVQVESNNWSCIQFLKVILFPEIIGGILYVFHLHDHHWYFWIRQVHRLYISQNYFCQIYLLNYLKETSLQVHNFSHIVISHCYIKKVGVFLLPQNFLIAKEWFSCVLENTEIFSFYLYMLLREVDAII